MSSAAEGKMEGVLVSARAANSPISTTVATDSQGRYTFPGSRLQPGNYRLSIRAIGYELEDPGVIQVKANSPLQVDLKLQPTKSVAPQLTNAEWRMSFPGNEKQKESIDCVMCHTLQRVAESRHDQKGWLDTLHRMSSYTVGSSPSAALPIKKPDLAPRDDARQQPRAEYLASLNLSQAKTWPYS